MPDISVKGTPAERETFTDVFRHYTMAVEDLNQRTIGFDKNDILFRSHIDKKKWPYRSLVFDPIIFTALYEKTARTFANKPRGRMEPRKGGSVLGAKINNELLSVQWDENERLEYISMLAKWALMDLNTRKYGASFALAPWTYKRQVQQVDDKSGKKVAKSKIFFDGPDFKPWANRDVLHNPSYSTIKNWIQLRSYVTLEELENTNDAARSKPVYKNLDILRDSVKKDQAGSGDQRSSNYNVKNLTIKGLQDYLGRDQTFKTIEVITEYRNNRWITFAPKHGVIIRDIPNPYDHQQIPVIQLKYFPIDDDIYGLSQIEPVEKLVKAHNAYICQNLDQLNLNTYVPLKVRNRNGAVQMHTLEFGPGKKWLMDDPSSDVVAHDQGSAGIDQFVNVYRLMKSAIMEGLGESSAGVSTQEPGQNSKTATEIKDTASSRSAMDNFNQIFLGEAMKRQMMLWFAMNKQFYFNANETQKILRISGKDALKFFQNLGLDSHGLSEEHQDLLKDPELAETVNVQDLQTPLYPVETKDGIVPKLSIDEGGQGGELILEKDDLCGEYDYFADVGSMNRDASQQTVEAKGDFLSRVTGVDPKTGQPTGISAMMAQEGKRVKATDLMIDYAEDIGFKNADQYIENIPEPTLPEGGPIDPNTGQPIATGAGIVEESPINQANSQQPGLPQGI